MRVTRLLRRPSPAFVLASVALFAAMGGGAYAATSISGQSIAPHSIPGNRLESGAVGNRELGRISGTKLQTASVPGNRLRKGAIGNNQLGTFSGSHLTAGTVGSKQLADGSVGSKQLADGAVGSGQLAAGSVGSAQLATGAVGSTQLAAGSVGASQLAAGSVGSAQLAAGSVGSTALAASSVGEAQLGSVSGSHLQAGSVPESAEQLDYGIAVIYVVPDSQSGTPEESKAVEEPPLFTPSIPAERGDGATTSGTTVVECLVAECQLQVYATVNSNKEQPASGQAAADVGAGLVVESVETTGGNPVGGAEKFQTAGTTPPNSSLGESDLAPIPTRSPLAGNYPGPESDGIQVPLADPFTGEENVTVPGGFYVVHGTVNFLHYSG